MSQQCNTENINQFNTTAVCNTQKTIPIPIEQEVGRVPQPLQTKCTLIVAAELVSPLK
jgi:hypothetical protein